MTDSAKKIAINIRTTPRKLTELLQPTPEEPKREKHLPKSAPHKHPHEAAHEKEHLTKAAKLLRPHALHVTHASHATHVVERAAPEKPALVVKTKSIPEEPVVHHYPPPVLPSMRMAVNLPQKPKVVEGVTVTDLSVAYFCMEMGLESSIPTYAGGLGILAGDMLKSCAALDVATIGVTLLYHKGYFKQRLDESGWQFEEEEKWNPYEKLILLPYEVAVTIEGRTVRVRAWLYRLPSVRGKYNPVIFLDTDIDRNSEEDRHITDRLYSGDVRHRLKQEAILGIAGMRMLEAIGATNIEKFHMNEGHSALLTIELYRQHVDAEDPVAEVRRRSVFTTHTPVAAGHDQFAQDLVLGVLGVHYVPSKIDGMVFEGGHLNMTRLGLQFSDHINGVAKKHGEVTRELFPGYRIESITNGVFAKEWVAAPLAKLFDKYLPDWQLDPYSLRYALSIPGEELWGAHQESKQHLINHVNEKYNAQMNPDFFTIGFARRATEYKRANMLFSDIERLMRIADRSKGIQIIYAGKAHPDDNDGKLLIQHVIDNMRRIGHKIHCVYLPDYNIDIAKMLVSGVDLWLNTPTRPREASGTSGMKAALNGVPHFSVLDGWWLEGHIENVTGWSIGPHPEKGDRGDIDAEDIEDMYTKLEYVILPCFEKGRDLWAKIMRQAIAINGSFFNTHRMVEQYVLSAYFK